MYSKFRFKMQAEFAACFELKSIAQLWKSPLDDLYAFKSRRVDKDVHVYCFEFCLLL
jgi:hypothetical protein